MRRHHTGERPGLHTEHILDISVTVSVTQGWFNGGFGRHCKFVGNLYICNNPAAVVCILQRFVELEDNLTSTNLLILDADSCHWSGAGQYNLETSSSTVPI